MTSAARQIAAGTLAVVFFLLFVGLGTWQVQRRAWKLDLIDHVERRVHAPPVAAPPPAEWPLIKKSSHEYLHVRTAGVFLAESQTLVRALTELGSGFWVMTPLRMTDGNLVLVNRGFVSGDAYLRNELPPAVSPRPVTVTGLLRITEPGGAFLRRNDVLTDRWYSRDVQAIASARRLGPVAPYFIDAEDSAANAANAASPTGGLTVITFANNHLIYAITWYTLAIMIPAALWLARRSLESPTTP